jgi:predicted DNA-binding transcriptional regulator AlpA
MTKLDTVQSEPKPNFDPSIERLLTTEDVARLLGRTVNTVVIDRCKGTGPRFVKLGRHVRYRASDVAAFVASRLAYSSTSEVAASPT